MKNIQIYPIRSLMRHNDLINLDSQKLIDELKVCLGSNYLFSFTDEIINDNDLLLILVQSGGSENIFKEEIFNKYDGPYYLLTYGSSNSLAASLEIISFVKQNKRKGEVLHGDIDYICNRIVSLTNTFNQEDELRLGVLGKPSDWLISSNVDYQKALDIFNLKLIDISQEEVVEAIQSVSLARIDPLEYDYNPNEIKKALQIHEGIKKIVGKYDLNGFTIRCFDIIQIVKSSACLSLALFNQYGITASCEGDIPSMITSCILQNRFNYPAFQANPQFINPADNTIELAHCTLPLNMCNNYKLDTHFESGIGVGIHGEMECGDVTIVKINNDLDLFYCEEGKILNNDYRRDRCRTQIKIELNSDVTYFLNSSLGNHHLIIYGLHQKEISEYLKNKGLRQVK